MVDGGPLTHLDRHLARLKASIAALGYPPLAPGVSDQIEALAATATTTSRLRVLARPAEHATDVELQLIPLTLDAAKPIDLGPAIVPGGLGPHKWLDRALVDELTARLGATPLLIDTDGTVLEAGWANIWWLDGDTLCTPPLDGRILPGIVRRVLLERSAEAPLEVVERSADFAQIADLPLLLTSARGVSVARLRATSEPVLARSAALRAELSHLIAGTVARR